MTGAVTEYVVTEGIAGTWHYHLSLASDTTRSLCGVQTMPTRVPVTSWGTKGHLKESWCSQCRGVWWPWKGPYVPKGGESR